MYFDAYTFAEISPQLSAIFYELNTIDLLKSFKTIVEDYALKMKDLLL